MAATAPSPRHANRCLPAVVAWDLNTVGGLLRRRMSDGGACRVNEAHKKEALRKLTYGLYVLTSAHAEDISAGTVNWLSQCSFHPPLVMVGVKMDSHLYEVIRQSGAFAVNLLAEGQKPVAQEFFKPTRLVDGTLNGFAFERGPVTGSPLLVDLPAWFEVKCTDFVTRGDHAVVVGEVVEAGVRRDFAPLVMWSTGWFYGG